MDNKITTTENKSNSIKSIFANIKREAVNSQIANLDQKKIDTQNQQIIGEAKFINATIIKDFGLETLWTQIEDIKIQIKNTEDKLKKLDDDITEIESDLDDIIGIESIHGNNEKDRLIIRLQVKTKSQGDTMKHLTSLIQQLNATAGTLNVSSILGEKSTTINNGIIMPNRLPTHMSDKQGETVQVVEKKVSNVIDANAESMIFDN